MQPIHTIGIIGHGAFGMLLETLIKRFAPAVSVRIYSSRQVPDQNRFFSFEDTCKSDAVIFSVPIHAFEETLVKALPFLSPATIVVDVATVKTHTLNVLKKYEGKFEYIATHPMWGPESYKKRNESVEGFRIVITEHTLQEGVYGMLTDFLKEIGFVLIETTADVHDRMLAETLFLTHFVGQVITKAKYTRTSIDTVSFGFLMDAVESVKHDTDLFKDVFRFNPYCAKVIETLEKAHGEVKQILINP